MEGAVLGVEIVVNRWECDNTVHAGRRTFLPVHYLEVWVCTTEYISLQEMKQGQCICPLSWSVHCNFTGDGKCNERGWACTPHPHQARLVLHSWLNVCQKADVTTLCTLWFVLCRHLSPKTGGLHNAHLDAQSASIPRVRECMTSRPNWDSPTPSPASEWMSPSPGTKKGGHTRLRVSGWGWVLIRTTGEKA
jgi:hypothetical protein